MREVNVTRWVAPGRGKSVRWLKRWVLCMSQSEAGMDERLTALDATGDPDALMKATPYDMERAREAIRRVESGEESGVPR